MLPSALVIETVLTLHLCLAFSARLPPPSPPAKEGAAETLTTTRAAARADRMDLLKVALNILISVRFLPTGILLRYEDVSFGRAKRFKESWKIGWKKAVVC